MSRPHMPMPDNALSSASGTSAAAMYAAPSSSGIAASRPSSMTTSERPVPSRQGSGDVLSYYFHDLDSDGQPTLSRPSTARTMGSMTQEERPTNGGLEVEGDSERTPRAKRQLSGDKQVYAAAPSSPVKGNGTANGNGIPQTGEVQVHRRRSSKTANASDKRRLAIVEVDTPSPPRAPTDQSLAPQDESTPTVNAPSLLARRGMDTSRLALVAPPDASPLTYTDLSPAPPGSAPPAPRPAPAHNTEISTHTRSRSHAEGALAGASRRSASSRDIGIVGAVRSPGRTPTKDERPGKQLGLDTANVPTLPETGLGLPQSATGESTAVAPIFQIPTTRTSSPDVQSEAASSRERLAADPVRQQPRQQQTQAQYLAGRMVTPEIGESKELGTAVAGPVVTMLSGVSPQLAAPSAFPAGYVPPIHPSPSPDYSLAASPGNAYYAQAITSPPQPYGYRFQGTHINYDPVLHATAGPLPEPPRMTNLTGLAPPPPRPPRVSRSRSPLKDQLQTQKGEEKPPSSTSAASPPPTAPQQQEPITTELTPKPPQLPFVLPMPNPLVRSMSDYSITAVSASSESDYEPATTPPTSEPAATSSNSKSARASSDERTERTANASIPSHPPSAFRRNSRSSRRTATQISSSPDKPDLPPSSQVSPSEPALVVDTTKLEPPSQESTPPKSKEETELEEMLASMAPALMGEFEPAGSPVQRTRPLEKTQQKEVVPQLVRPAHTPEQEQELQLDLPPDLPPAELGIVLNLASPAAVEQPEPQPMPQPQAQPQSISPPPSSKPATPPHPEPASSPPLPALPLEAAPPKPEPFPKAEPIQRPEPIRVQLQDSPEIVSPVKSSEAEKEDSASSYESFVHASRPTTPISEATASPGNKHSRRPSLTLAFTPKGSKTTTSDTRERSPSLSSQLGRFAGQARRGAAERPIRSPWGAAKPNPVQKAKAIATWPAAMRFEDVLRMKTPLERAQGYARKINELAQVESGLTDWIIAIKSGSLTPDGLNKLRVPSGNASNPSGHRKVSAGSQLSDASFPTRPDATVATEIPSSDNDSPPLGAPANLPYPALAQGIGQRSQSTRSYGSSLSVNTTPSRSTSSGPLSAKKAGGFFSSIGRKNSIKRERNLPLPNPNPLSRQTSSPLSAGAVLSSSDSPTRFTRPMAGPSIPGGPREPPGRLHKANPVSRRSSLDSPLAISPPLPTNALDKRRSVGHSAVGQYARPLEAPRGARAYGALDETSTQFTVSLQKMADILPQASRPALARYLTDANGEEMLAITRYIDDEKRGAVQP